MRSIAALAAVVTFVLACTPQTPSAQDGKPSGEIVAVHVTAGGVITMNGREVSLEQVKQEFTRLGAAQGTVQYSRDNPTADPHPNAMEVIKAAADGHLNLQVRA